MHSKYVVLGSAALVLILAAGALYFFTRKGTDTTAPSSGFTTETVSHGVINGSSEGVTVITLTKDGFKPSELTIKKGTTIMFKNTTGNLYWPASNLHPSHLIYPEFDPQTPVAPTDTWSYTFEKVGEWKFHDHLSPYFTGTITVTE